jgi:hypothetical protein
MATQVLERPTAPEAASIPHRMTYEEFLDWLWRDLQPTLAEVLREWDTVPTG